MPRHKYTTEEIEFLKNNVKGISVKELTDRFNKQFGCNITASAVSNRKNKYKLKSEINTGRFKKGNIPYNAGTKGLKKANIGSFKKGNIPKNTRKIGSERISGGFVIVKVANPDKWRMKHHVIYEKYHKVKIGRWDKVIFLDGNKKNFDINNLELVTNSEQVIIKNKHLQSNNIEVSKSYVTLAKLMSKIKRIKKGREKNKTRTRLFKKNTIKNR